MKNLLEQCEDVLTGVDYETTTDFYYEQSTMMRNKTPNDSPLKEQHTIVIQNNKVNNKPRTGFKPKSGGAQKAVLENDENLSACKTEFKIYNRKLRETDLVVRMQYALLIN